MRRIGERFFDVSAREGRGVQNIVMHPEIALWVNFGRIRLHRLERIGDRFENRVIHFDFVGSLARVECSIRDHHGQKISDATGGFTHRNENRQV